MHLFMCNKLGKHTFTNRRRQISATLLATYARLNQPRKKQKHLPFMYSYQNNAKIHQFLKKYHINIYITISV